MLRSNCETRRLFRSPVYLLAQGGAGERMGQENSTTNYSVFQADFRATDNTNRGDLANYRFDPPLPHRFTPPASVRLIC